MSLSRRDGLGLLAWLTLCFLVAALGAVASVSAASFYGELVQPPWAPPAGVFGPMWGLLYAMMAIAAWLVWRAPKTPVRQTGLVLFLVQLGVNALWSWLFFAWHLGGPALIDVLLLLCLVAASVFVFWRVRRLAALLLVPYLLWVGFAAALNASIWHLNPQSLGPGLI